MILTRCPGCTTVFRVTPEQLAARQGMVRCGRCGTAFNALDNRAAGGGPPAPGAPAAEPAAPSALDLARAEEPPDSAAESTELAPPVAPEATAGSAPPPADPVHPSPGPLPSPQPVASHPAVETAFPSLIEPGPPPEPPAVTAVPPPVAEPIQTPAASTPAAQEAPTYVPPAPDSSPDLAAISRWAPSASAAEETRSRRPLLLRAAVAALAGLALLQGAVVMRHGLVLAFPGMRPALEALCAPFGCRLELPRHADLVSIETSDLQPDPKQAGQLILGAAVRNRADFAQALPHLELTLTDARDRALARRVFAPSDYLPANANAAAGIGAGQELAVHLVIDAGSIGASGYRLYVFYP